MLSVSPHSVPVLCMQLIAATQQLLHLLLVLGGDICMLHSAVMAFVSPHALLDVCAHSCLF